MEHLREANELFRKMGSMLGVRKELKFGDLPPGNVLPDQGGVNIAALQE